MQPSNFFRLIVLLSAFSLIVVCTDDDGQPRDPGGGGGGGPTHSTSSGQGDAGDVEDVEDAEDDEDTQVDVEADTADVGDDADTGDPTCELEPPQSGDERYPCCYSDEDCLASTSGFANELRCYHSVCEEGGAGTCRFPPDLDNECWGDRDCQEGQSCMFEPEFHCTDPFTEEVPDVCIDG